MKFPNSEHALIPPEKISGYPKFGSWNSCRGEFIRQINVLQANEFAPTKTRMFIIVLTFYVQLPDLGLSVVTRSSNWKIQSRILPFPRI
ncbi:MAG: hypothetical protein WCI11_11525 [Candidatus Methylumidiphilus sp.]